MDIASKIKEIREFVVIRIPTITEIREFVVFRIPTVTEIRKFVVIKIKNPPRFTEEDSYNIKIQYLNSLSALRCIYRLSCPHYYQHIYP